MGEGGGWKRKRKPGLPEHSCRPSGSGLSQLPICWGTFGKSCLSSAFWTILRLSILQGNWGHWLQHVHTSTQPQGQKRRHMIRQQPWPALRPLLFTSPVACSLLRLREWMCLDAPGLGAGRSSFHSAPAMQIPADPSPSLDPKSPPCTVAGGWGCIGGIGWSPRLSPFSSRL